MPPVQRPQFALQWSRFFSKRKIRCAVVGRDERLAASMEPLFFKAENHSDRIEEGSQPWLQWSRFFSKRKISSAIYTVSRPLQASMEPLFFKAENRFAGLCTLRCKATLQWSRFFSKRKITFQRFSHCGTSEWLQWSRFFSKRKIAGFS